MLAAASVSNPGLFAAFGAGVLSFLSPCVLPLVPGYLSLMSGVATTGSEDPRSAERLKVATSAFAFVVGFSLVFIAYGAAASSLGALVVDHKRTLTYVSGVLMVAMGVFVSGLFTPWLLMRERRVRVDPARLGPYAAPVMGMAFAFGWTPCIGPVLAAVLALAATRETLSNGVSLLAAYSAGLGVPFLVSGVALGSARTTMKWFTRHGRVIDIVSGTLLVVFGVLVFSGQLTHLSTAVIHIWTWMGLDRLTVG